MGDSQRDILSGYLLGALEQHENELVESKLARDTLFREELFSLQKEVKLLEEYRVMTQEQYRVSPDLASRTCRSIWDQIDAPLQNRLRDETLERSLHRLLKPQPAQTDSGVLTPLSSTVPGSRESTSSPYIRRRFESSSSQSAPRRLQRLIENLPSLLIGALIAFILYSAFQYGKEYVRTVYTRNLIQKFGENSAVSAQMRDQSIIPGSFLASSLLSEGEQPVQVDYADSDIGGLLAGFGEAALSAPLLSLTPNGHILTNERVTNERNVNGQQRIDNQEEIPRDSALTSLGFQPFTFSSQNVSPQSKGLPYALIEHQQQSNKVLFERKTDSFEESAFELKPGQNTFYQDNRIFFRRTP
ncbi:MAG: hypothetical protein ACRC10_01465 [Thermoguttaceae bacterium]